MNTYRAFGLSIASEITMAEYAPDASNARADVVIRRVADMALPGPTPHFVYGSEIHTQAWPNVGAFRIRGDAEIDVQAIPGANEWAIQLPLIGSVMGMLLHRRGLCVLHASAVAIDGRAVIFLGGKGAGKSTTAAAAVAAGWRLVTDDVLAVNIGKSRSATLAPGYPQLKLAPSASQRVKDPNAVDLRPTTTGLVKVLRRWTAFDATPIAPACIYVLRRGASAQIKPMAAGAGLRALLDAAYAPIFPGMPWSPAEAGKLWLDCAALANTAKVRALETPDDIERLSEVLAAIEHDLSETANTEQEKS